MFTTSEHSNREAFQSVLRQARSAEKKQEDGVDAPANETKHGETVETRRPTPRLQNTSIYSYSDLSGVSDHDRNSPNRTSDSSVDLSSHERPVPDDVPRPFERITMCRHRSPSGFVYRSEVPNADWTNWTTLSPGSGIGNSIVVHHTTLDVSGLKTEEYVRLLPGDLLLFFETTCPQVLMKEDTEVQRDDPPRIIPRWNFKMLYLLKQELLAWMQDTAEPSAARASIQALVHFVDVKFPEAERIRNDMILKRETSFEHIWLLFEPQGLVYEKRLIPPYETPYDQFFRLIGLQDIRNSFDGQSMLRLIVEELIYIRAEHGYVVPALVPSTRHIRKFEGLKNITADDLGLVPYNMISSREQKRLLSKLGERSRQYIHLSTMPFSIWHYTGPLSLAQGETQENLKQDMAVSLNERFWQKHVDEKLVVDIATSGRHLADNFDVSDQDLHNLEPGMHEIDLKPLRRFKVSDLNLEGEGGGGEELLLICRGYVPAYLLSSGVYAVKVLVSGLRPPTWSPGSLAGDVPNLIQWESLIRKFFSESETINDRFQRRAVQGAGLILLLLGPRKNTRSTALYIAEKLQRPLMTISHTEFNHRYVTSTATALKWGAILAVDQNIGPNDDVPRAISRFTENLSFYPSLLFLLGSSTAGPDPTNTYKEAIDAVISCEPAVHTGESSEASLWRQYFAAELPDMVENTTDTRLAAASRVLAQTEPREARMSKIFKTAKRLALSQNTAVLLDHVFLVVRSSLTANDRELFDKAVDRLGS